jgi:MerR family transcriptional regulator, light-induced transcriptional regulator
MMTVRRNHDSNVVQSYLDALVAGDEVAAATAVSSMITEGRSIADVYIKLLTPAMTRIGELWRKNKINVAQQKLATQITLSQMDRLRSGIVAKRQSPYRALVCCVQGEMHSTGARMVADLLRLEGWLVDFLGADVPTGDVVAMVQKKRTQMVALSVTMKANLQHARSLGATLRELAIPPKVIIGGDASANLRRWKPKDLDFKIAANLLEGMNIALSAFHSALPKADLEKYLKDIGQRIRELRTNTGQTQAQLAASAGLNRAYIVSVERGKQNISMAVVVKIANALGVSIEQLLLA